MLTFARDAVVRPGGNPRRPVDYSLVAGRHAGTFPGSAARHQRRCTREWNRQPLIVGKFGPHHKEVNVAWLWARLKSRTTRLGTFQGGFQAFADAFAGRLQEMGVGIQLSTSVKRVSLDADCGVAVEVATGQQGYDQCLVTTSPALLARLAPDLPRAYLEGLLRLRSMGAVVMILALKHQLSEEGFYLYASQPFWRAQK